ncbi:hypothetical protein SOCE26_049450 [Sorangium cellulosum]|uniref:DUF1990 domain-containing protein n=1 Tax=Sorangium cellulosum TaxID=56 RepID=A0A2L0EW25_SORCE|nr:DUF1990 domain-containing protein [Sorangium cellulosum]AUX43496.1 hypothetical protein SOCE26_049450 [Sorangium cellulosum]
MPSDAAIRAFLDRQAGRPLSYAEVGCTGPDARRGRPPAGSNLDRHHTVLGQGAALFARAAEALRRWEHFRLGWVELCYPDAPIEAGVTVGILVRVLGFHWLNACRIVYTIDETSGPVRRFGFAYGTLEEHGERGEERFVVEHHEQSGEVGYEIFAVSRPNHVLAKLGYPYARRLQARFARGSMRAMQRAVAAPSAVTR